MGRVTERDVKLFRTLDAFGVLTTGQIQELLFSKVRHTTLCRRLRLLEKQSLIYRVRGLPNGGQMWGLSPQCANAFGYERPILRVNRNSLEHDVCLSNVRIALTKSGIVERWVPEHELRRVAWKDRYEKKRSYIEGIPDAILTAKVSGEFRVVALELEAKMKSKDRYKKIFERHCERKSIWLVWYLVPERSIGKRLEALWLKQPEYLKRRVGFAWSVIPEILANPEAAKIHQDDKEYLLTQVFRD